MSLENAYTRALRAHDRDVYCARNREGTLCVFRKHKRYVEVAVDDGFRLLNLITDRQFVFALTDTWGALGAPRAWGIDRVVQRLREHDTQVRENLLEEIEREQEKARESEERHVFNEAEAFFKENRKQFLKGVDASYGSLTSLSKDEPTKRLRDRRIKNGSN